MKISVYGSASGEISEESRKKAREIGRQIAKAGHIVVTGACPGLPLEAALGAQEEEGQCIGFSPGVDLEAHKQIYDMPLEPFSEIIYIPKSYEYANDPLACKKYRNISSVAFADAAIFVGGQIGTMNEFTNAYDYGRKIGVLEGSGGISDQAIKTFLECITKETGAKILFDSDPITLVKKIIK